MFPGNYSFFINLYIPLCLYFNGASVRGNVSQSQLYIPLCLYFNVRRPSFSSAENSFTFHYVSILMMNSTKSEQWLSGFTFHYVSILMWASKRIRAQRSDFTFHYVSILISNPYSSSAGCFQLYIPLCLYFNMPLKVPLHQRADLYIPLCLYFNKRTISKWKCEDRLYIPLCLYFNLSAGLNCIEYSNFTFHYVSILIPEYVFPHPAQVSLHSIMSLF